MSCQLADGKRSDVEASQASRWDESTDWLSGTSWSPLVSDAGHHPVAILQHCQSKMRCRPVTSSDLVLQLSKIMSGYRFSGHL